MVDAELEELDELKGRQERRARAERVRIQMQQSFHDIKKIKRLSKIVFILLCCVIVGISYLGMASNMDRQKSLAVAGLSLFVFLLLTFSFLYVRQLTDNDEAHRRISAIYLYAEELRDYSVENIDVLFDAVNKLAIIPEQKFLAEPPSVHIPQSEVDKPLLTRERQTLLTIIAALAKAAKINVDQPGKAALSIEGFTNDLGAHVSKRAIEEHLKKIPDALETRMK